VKARIVVFAPEAHQDLRDLYDWIAGVATPGVALAYIERIETFCRGLPHAAERGRNRDDIRQGLRIVGFKRRAAIAFAVNETAVTILRVFHGGRDWENALH